MVNLISNLVFAGMLIGGVVLVLLSMAAIPMLLISPILYVFTWVTDPKLKKN
jgi:hypothetical protein